MSTADAYSHACTRRHDSGEHCGAKPGQPCIGPDLRERSPHPERIEAARRAGAAEAADTADEDLRAWVAGLHPGNWIGVDFDRTLCTYDGEWRDGLITGEPIAPMVERVRRWLAAGLDVRIFTARANQPDEAGSLGQREQIEAWCMTQFGRFLPVTATKDYRMVEAWDDAMVSVERGTGRRLAPSNIPGERR